MARRTAAVERAMRAGGVTTDRLRGERTQAGHAPLYEQLYGSDAVAAWLWPPPHGGARSPAQARELLDRDLAHWQSEDFGPWVVFEAAGDERFVGHGGLRRGLLHGEDIIEVLYAIEPACWGQGYATEIARAAVQRARELALPELVGFTLTTNLASQRVLHNAGLRFERELEHAGLPHWFGRFDLSRAAGK